MTIKLTTHDTITSKINVKRPFSIYWNVGNKAHLAKLTLSFSLNNRQQLLTNYLLSQSATDWSELIPVIVEHMTDHYNIPTSSCRRNLNELVEVGILKRHEVEIEGKLMERGIAYTFATVEEMQESLAKRTTSKLLSETNRGNYRDNRESIVEGLAQFGIIEEDQKIREHLPPGVVYTPSLIPREYLALADERSNKKNRKSMDFRKPYGKHGVFNYRVIARAHEQINTKQSLSTLMALLMIGIAHNTKLMKSKRYEKAFEQKQIPISMVDILYVRGLKDSGQARRRITDQVTQLRETIYNWVDLGTEYAKSLSEDPILGELFKTVDFQYLVSLETNATIAPITTKTGKTIVNPSLFIIQFHDLVIKNLVDSDYFFTIPDSIAFGDPLVFVFYLSIRTMQATISTISLKELADRIYYLGSSEKLLSSLTLALEKYAIKNDEFQFNLCGYYLRFFTDVEGKHSLYIVCDLEQLVVESGGVFDPALGNKNAPTIANPLKYLSSAESIKLDEAVSQIVIALNDDYLLKASKRSAFYSCYDIDGRVYTVSKYTDNKELLEFRDAIRAAYGLTEKYASLAQDKILDATKLVAYESLKIGTGLFDDILAFLKERDVIVSTVELIDILKTFREKKLTICLSGDYEVVLDAIEQKRIRELRR